MDGGAGSVDATDVLDLVVPWFREAPQRIAVAGSGERLTYADLAARTDAIADGLRSDGLRPGDGVVIHARLSPWAVVAMLGVLRAGGRYVPVDAGFPPQRQRMMAELSGARFVLRQPGVPELPPAKQHDNRPGLAYTCFTSGSTGIPKRVDIPVPALAYSTAARLAYYPEPVSGFLLCSSISFDSSVAGIYWTLASGGTLVVASDRAIDLVPIARAAAAHEASHLLMIPSLYRMLVSGGLVGMLATVRAAIVAGESCPPSLVATHYERLPETVLYNEYGPTECTVWSTVHACVAQDGAARSVPIGRPIPGTAVHLRDEAGAAVADGAVGEMWIAGPGVAAPTRDGMYRTGDLARRRPDGLLEFHGRTDTQIKLSGARVETGEIEHVLLRHGCVSAAAVGVADRGGSRPRLTAFVVPRPGAEVDAEALRAHVRQYLPAAAVPVNVVTVQRIPTHANGKVDHRALDELSAHHDGA